MGLMVRLLAALGAALLAIGLVGCGGDEDSSTTTGSSATKSTTPKSKPTPATGGGKREVEAEASDDKSEKSSPKAEKKEASEFVPKQHDDSGGGSKQFRAPEGYDNSIQDFGAETTGSDFEEAAAVLHNFYDARAEGNWAATCQYMSRGMVESFEQLAQSSKRPGQGCADLVKGMTGPLLDGPIEEEAEAIDVRSLRADGDRGFLIYLGLEDTVYAMPMEREDGRWKVTAYAGSPIS